MPVVSTRPCIGCTRNSDQDFSYLAEGKIVFDWHYGGDKGCWCRDCFNLWRTKFKPKLSLVLFSRWIKDNRLEYLGFLLAFLTLKFEGVQHVVLSRIDARERLLRFAFNLSGYPFPFADVVSIEDGLGMAEAHCLRCVGGGLSAVCLVPTTLQLDASTSFRFVSPAAAKARPWPLHPFASDEPKLLAVFDKVFPGARAAHAEGDDAEMVSEASNKLELDDSKGAAPEAANDKKLAAKAKDLIRIYKITFKAITEAEPKGIKEKEIGNLVDKILRAKAEAVDRGLVQCEALDDMTTLLILAQATKKVVKHVREYSKSSKTTWLVSMYEHLQVIIANMDIADIQLSATWFHMWCRSQFFFYLSGNDEENAFKHLHEAFDGSLCPLEPNADADVVVGAVMTWIVVVLRKEIDDPIFGGSTTEWSDKKELLMKWVGFAQECVQKLMVLMPTLSSALDLLEKFVILVQGAINGVGVTPSDISLALSYFEGTGVRRRVGEALEHGCFGMALTADFNKLVAKGEMDEQCLEEFDSGLSSLFAEGMPKATTDGQRVVALSMVAAACDGQCDLVSLCAEAIQAMTGAFKSWSSGAMYKELESGSFVGAINQLVDCITAYDKARARSAVMSLAEMRAQWSLSFMLAEDVKMDWASWRSTALPSTKPLREAEKPMKDFSFDLKKFIAGGFMQALIGRSKELEKACSDMYSVLCDWETRMTVREELWEETETILKLLELEWGNTDDMIDAYGQSGESFLNLVVDLTLTRSRWQGKEGHPVDFSSLLGTSAVRIVCDKGQNDDATWEEKAEALFEEFADGHISKAISGAFLVHAAIESLTKVSAESSVLALIDMNVLVDQWAANHTAVETFRKMVGGDEQVVADLSAKVDSLLVEYTEGIADSALSALTISKASATTCTLLRASALEELWANNVLATEALPVASAAKLMDGVTHVMTILVGTAWVCEQLWNSRVVVENKKGKEVSKVVLEMLGELDKRCEDWEAFSKVLLPIAEGVGMKVPMATLQHVVSMVQRGALSKCKMELLIVCKQVVAGDTSILEKSTPKFQHIVNKKYHGKLAKVQLLEGPHRDVLPDLIKALHGLVVSVSSLVRAWNLGDPSEIFELAAAEAILDLATLTMAVIAGVNVIEDIQAAEKPAMAKALLASSTEFPPGLRDKLKEWANKAKL